MSHISTADHVSLFYKDWGSGAPVLFLHSWSLSSTMWQYQMVRLAEQGLRCVAYDRRGHGRSDQPWDGYDLDTLADDLAMAEANAVSVKAMLDLSHAVCDTDHREDLRRIDVPALVVHGADDPFNPVQLCGHGTASLIPSSQLKVYENASHGLHLTHVDQLSSDLLDFIEQ